MSTVNHPQFRTPVVARFVGHLPAVQPAPSSPKKSGSAAKQTNYLLHGILLLLLVIAIPALMKIGAAISSQGNSPQIKSNMSEMLDASARRHKK